MAKNFDIKIRATNGEQAAAAIKAFADEAQRAMAQIKRASDETSTASTRTARAVEEAARSSEKLVSSGGRLRSLGDTFEVLEGGTKKVNRTLNDAVGTFQLLGSVSGAAGSQLSILAGTIGNVADVFGTLANILGKHPLLTIASVATLAATAFVTFRNRTDEARKAQELLGKAIAASNELLATQAERAAAAAEKQRQAAVADVDAARSLNQRKLEDERNSLRALEGQLTEERRRASEREQGRVDFGFLGSTQRPIDTERVAKRISELEGRLAEQQRVVDDLERRRQQLDPTALAERQRFLREGEEAEQALKARQQSYIDELNRQNESDRIIRERNERAAEEASRLGEQRRREIEAENAQVAEFERRIAENYDKRDQAVAKFITKLEEESRLSGETNEQREIGLRIYEAQSKLVDDLGKKTRDLTDAEKERIADAVKTKAAMEEQAKAAERLQQEIDRAAKRSTDRLVDFAGDALFDRLTGKVTNFWETFRQYGLRAISQLAAEMVFRPVIAPIVGAAVSAAPALFGASSAQAATSSGGLGGLGSLINSPIGSIASLGSNLLGGGGGFLSSITSPLSAIGGGIAGALGFQVGTAGAMVGASAVGGPAFLGGATSLASGAGALGAGVISPLAATGIGALVAIPALLALGGLFGKKKNVGPFASYAGWLNPDGSIDFKSGGEKNGGSMAQMAEATQAMAQAIRQTASVLGIFKLPTLDVGVGSNQARGTFYGTGGSEPAAVYFGNDAGEAGAAYVRAALRGELYGGSRIMPSTEAARIFAATTGDVKSDLEFVAVYQSLDKAADASAKVSMALDELTAKFDDYADKARKYGLEVERIEKAREETIESTVANFLGPLNERFNGIRGLIASLQVGPSSPLSAEEQLSYAREQFSTLSASALTGDETAQRALGDAGRSYLDLARGYFGTTESYAKVYADVIGRIGDLVTSVRDTDPTVRAIVETGERGTAAVTKLLGTLVDEVKRLRDEVRRANDIPVRVL